MPISVNENGVVKPLGTNILYERHLRYIPWHTKYQALTGHDCVVGNVDLFCTVDLSFTPDYVFVKKARRNAIFFQNDSHSTSFQYNNWYYSAIGTSSDSGFYNIVILTPVHSRHNMGGEDCSFDFEYDISNDKTASTKSASVYTAFELIDNTVKCYFSITSNMVNTAPKITAGLGFGYDGYLDTWSRILEFEIEAFGNCQSIAV